MRVECSGMDGPLSTIIHAPMTASTPTTKKRMTRLKKNFNRRRLAMADSFSNLQITRWVGGWCLVVGGFIVPASVRAQLLVRHRLAGHRDSALRASPARNLLALDHPHVRRDRRPHLHRRRSHSRRRPPPRNV